MPSLSSLPSRPASLPGHMLLLALLMATLLLGAQAVGATDQDDSFDWSQLDPSQTRELSPKPSAVRSNGQSELDTSIGDIMDRAERIGRSDDRSGLDSSALQLQSASALIVDERGNRLYSKNTRQVKPIASVSKLMTAMVVLDAGVSMDTPITIIEADRDRLRNSRSRLRIGEATLPRREMMMVALMSSDNRAASALARTTFSGGKPTFVRAMNRKAQALGMTDTWFEDSTGLDNRNRSTAEDLVKMVKAAATYPFIRSTTSRGELTVYPFADHSPLQYRNTNPLVRNPTWQVEVSKTGFINEAGHCLVMQARIDDRRLYIVLLDAAGKLTPVADSNRLRSWMLAGK